MKRIIFFDEYTLAEAQTATLRQKPGFLLKNLAEFASAG